MTEREGPDERGAGRGAPRCLLFKRFQSFGEDVTRPYVRALEARRIPHVLVGGRSFHEREEVLAVRNALAAIEWPDDELSVYATLRGPFFALGDDALLAFRHAARRAPPAPPARRRAALETDADARGRRRAGDPRQAAPRAQPPADRRHLARLLEATRAHAGVAIWPTGEQALANVLRVHRSRAPLRGRAARRRSARSSSASKQMPSAAARPRPRSSKRGPRACAS